MCEPLHSAASFILFSSQYSILRFSLFFANPITSFSSIPAKGFGGIYAFRLFIKSSGCWFGVPASSAVADYKVKVSRPSFFHATTHFGAIELLAEYFSSTRKNYIPLSCQVSCMHRETYHKIPRFSDCGWPPTIISEGESLRVQAALEATIPALYCLL
ncbi:hypothetical protein Ahy_A04g017148 isoform A [Arachis hypogaea]|uniref:Uncharacterized protein n=1 Tax=Arachis hypogaea TaxID=3818 RepID=A0A445DA65_ARAHY|nr:hypothetical protein Ahy_A04g017148 isoform A [Arachis hypogaea]